MEIKSSNSLESSVYKDALALRKEVFIMEQGVSLELEVVGEKGPLYFTGYLAEIPVATARVFEEAPGIWHIQRVAVKKAHRGQGLARELLTSIEASAREHEDQAQTFYKKLGYQVVGEGFMDAGIAHHRMDKELLS